MDLFSGFVCEEEGGDLGTGWVFTQQESRGINVHIMTDHFIAFHTNEAGAFFLLRKEKSVHLSDKLGNSSNFYFMVARAPCFLLHLPLPNLTMI